MPSRRPRRLFSVEKISLRITEWMGTPQSIILHTILFSLTLSLSIAGFNPQTIMLILTTAVSLEAIYLSLFIQMSVNRQAKALKAVEKDIDAIQQDVEDIETIEQEVIADTSETEASLDTIEKHLLGLSASVASLQAEIQNLKSGKHVLNSS